MTQDFTTKIMTQEEKKLLLKDLCARLPYGVKVQYNNEIYNIDYISALYEEVKLDVPDNYTIGISEIKPYLRPMSSMTEEEKEELKQISNDYLDEWEHTKTSLERLKLDAKVSYKRAVFYNSHHFDWNDLISKDLAIEVTEENNPYEA